VRSIVALCVCLPPCLAPPPPPALSLSLREAYRQRELEHGSLWRSIHSLAHTVAHIHPALADADDDYSACRAMFCVPATHEFLISLKPQAGGSCACYCGFPCPPTPLSPSLGYPRPPTGSPASTGLAIKASGKQGRTAATRSNNRVEREALARLK